MKFKQGSEMKKKDIHCCGNHSLQIYFQTKDYVHGLLSDNFQEFLFPVKKNKQPRNKICITKMVLFIFSRFIKCIK